MMKVAFLLVIMITSGVCLDTDGGVAGLSLLVC